jgi:hypothetical protein
VLLDGARRFAGGVRSMKTRIAKGWTALYVQPIGPLPD